MFDSIVPPSVPPIQGDNYSAQAGCFEGPEKLLEIWFSPSPYHIARHQKLDGYNESDCELSDDSTPQSPTQSTSDSSDQEDPTRFSPEPVRRDHATAYDASGLRTIAKPVWDEMLAIVKCTVLNVIKNEHVDAYLLSESSMFVYPHKLILKTCGTTTLLMALPRILELAKIHCGFEKVWRVFYSRKSFMFPDRQCGPHRSWQQEVNYLDEHFDNGSAYKIGSHEKNHWYLYLTSPADDVRVHHDINDDDGEVHHQSGTHTPRNIHYESGTSTPFSSDSETDPSPFGNSGYPQQDETVEILMTDLNPEAMKFFYQMNDEPTGIEGGRRVDASTGIANIYPTAKVDSFLFEPCGYSANGLWEGAYFTIHVTPEPECSYASFETNIPCEISHKSPEPLKALIRQVLNVFQPGNFTVTLFSSQPQTAKKPLLEHRDGLRILEHDEKFEMLAKDKSDLHHLCRHRHHKMIHSLANMDGYKRTDRILYTFEGYDLVYGHYEQLA
ncbi:hypothetical protein INT43_006345 [Umbelopsis isabellina]|uniref:Adenosylmethionine decarboxylase n=1 Tax=Mortierella isabellina TaxID=91625 RepID=A0A8H7Q0L9_MORIS|nr:hypothetical protein INT43_006345 [Umbelopsis isabellina]